MNNSPTPPAGTNPPPPPPPPPPPAPVTRFAYMTADNSVEGFSVDPATGATMPLAQGRVKIGDTQATWIAADKTGKFVYVSGASSSAHGFKLGNDELAGFSIDRVTGNLTPVPGSPLILAQAAGAIVISPDGKFLYMGDVNGIKVFSIDQTTGGFTMVPGSPFDPPVNTTLDHAGAMAIAPSGKFIYVPQDNNVGPAGQVAVYAIDPTSGIPKAIAGSPFKIVPLFPSSIAADPLGRFLYTGGDIAAPNLDVKQVQANGSLSEASGSPFSTADHAIYMAAEPSGKFVYVTAGVGANSAIYGFSINQSSGRLTPITGSPFPLGDFAGGFTADQSGKFLYVGMPNGLRGYVIDPTTGALTAVPQNPPAAGGFANGVTTVAF